MKNLSKMNFMKRLFRKVDNVRWDLMSGNLAIVTPSGSLVSCEGEGEDAQIVENPFTDMSVELPAFAQNTPAEGVKIGDLIQTASIIGWVTDKTEKSFKIIKADGTRTTWTPPKVKMLDFANGVMVVRSLITMTGGESGLQNMQSMLLPMMMMGGDAADMESIMPMMLMSQMGTVPMGDGEEATNPMAGMNMAPMMQMMMMSKMMGGGSDGPGLFGGKNNWFDDQG